MLSDDEVAAYQRDGFVIAQELYDQAQMLQWKHLLQSLLDQEREAQKDDPWDMTHSGVRVWMSDVIHPTLRAAMKDHHVTPILQQIIGPNVEFLSAKVVFKNQETSFASPWHQDWFYWEGATKTSIWIAMDDATVANGCLKVIPGSHKKLFPKKVVRENAFVNQIDAGDLADLRETTLQAKRGDAIFFHDHLVHASHPNTAKTDRWSLISTYRDGSTKDSAEVWKSSMVVSGKSMNV